MLIGIGWDDDNEVVVCLPVDVKAVVKPKFDFGLLQPAAIAYKKNDNCSIMRMENLNIIIFTFEIL